MLVKKGGYMSGHLMGTEGANTQKPGPQKEKGPKKVGVATVAQLIGRKPGTIPATMRTAEQAQHLYEQRRATAAVLGTFSVPDGLALRPRFQNGE
jgi:hypothetical protein